MNELAAVCFFNPNTGLNEWRRKSDNTIITDAAIIAELEANGCKEERVTECVKWSTTVIFIDNTGTRFDESHVLEVEMSDGTTIDVSVDPTTGWTQQLNEWVAKFTEALPDCKVEARCNLPNGCGGLLGPPSDAIPTSAIFARYMSILCCPTDPSPVKVTITDSSNPARIGKILTQEIIQTKEKRGWRCVSCGETEQLFNEDWSEVPAADLPICLFVCAEVIPPRPETACNFSLQEGCDTNGSADQADWTSMVRVWTDCGEGLSFTDFVENVDGGLDEYEIIGEFVDCNSGDLVAEPPPEPPAIGESCDNPLYVENCNTVDVNLEENFIDVPCSDELCVTVGLPSLTYPLSEAASAAAQAGLTIGGQTYNSTAGGMAPVEDAGAWLVGFNEIISANNLSLSVTYTGDAYEFCGADVASLESVRYWRSITTVESPQPIEPKKALPTFDQCVFDKLCQLLEAQNKTNEILEELLCPEEEPPPAATIRCQSYGSFGSSSLIQRLTNPDLYHDPATNGPAGSPDFSCLNHYAIDLVAYDVQITTDAGATWTQAAGLGNPVVVTRWNSNADVPAAVADDMVAWVNSLPEVAASGVSFAASGTGWTSDKPADTEVRILYGFIYNAAGDPACRLDPFHRQWTDDFYVMASDGDTVWLGNSAAGDPAWITSAPTPNDYAGAAGTHDITTIGLVPMENCEPI